jgi:hypothetical protein
MANGPDALFSQGSIEASAKGMLAAVNPGSNTVSLFAINSKQPSLIQMVGQPMSSGGEFPMSVAFNKVGDKLCVLNGGMVNGVKCFTVDAKKGLVGISNTVRSLGINQTTPATGPAGTASHILFNEDGSQLIASVKGVPPMPGFVAIWDVAVDGSLSKAFRAIPPPMGGLLPFGMNFIPGKNAVLATDPASGFDIIDLSGKTNASAAVSVAGQVAVCWTSYSKNTGSFYLTDIGTSMVTEVSVDNNLKAKIVTVSLYSSSYAQHVLIPLCSNSSRLLAPPPLTPISPRSGLKSESTPAISPTSLLTVDSATCTFSLRTPPRSRFSRWTLRARLGKCR